MEMIEERARSCRLSLASPSRREFIQKKKRKKKERKKKKKKRKKIPSLCQRARYYRAEGI